MIGSLVVNEIVLPIVEIALHDGKIELVAELHVTGEQTIDLRGQARVHGRDGSVLGIIDSVRWPDDVTFPCTVKDGAVRLRLPVKLMEVR